MKTLDAIKDRWDMVLDHYNLALTGNRHILCGLCGKKKMRITMFGDNCSYICTCSNGSIINYLMEINGQSFVELANDIDSIIGNTHDKTEQIQIPRQQQKTLSNLRDYRGTDTEIYLQGRGIENMPEMSISHSDNEQHYDSEGNKDGLYPAMIAKITDSLSLEVLQIHITYLKNGKKFDRKVKGIASATDYKTPCVRLFPVGKTLGIAEGIETALSAHGLYETPVWATVNSGFMRRFRAPKGVTELIIFADNDKTGTGHAAAFECAKSNLHAKNDVYKVTVIWTSEIGDFNDLTNKKDICHWTFEK